MKQKDFYNSRAWWYCSKYVLLFYCDDNYVIRCSTCGNFYTLPDKRIQAGHYIKTDQYKATAFEFKNILPQCYKCNKHYSGKPDIMSQKLEIIHGKGTIEMLNIKKHNICKLDKFIMNYWKEYYKKLFKELVLKKGNPFK